MVKVINRGNNQIKFQVAKILIASEGKSISVECVENIPPPPPVRIRPRLNRRHRCVEILWDFPFNKQRDIKRFQVFKRPTINDPFVLVSEFDFDDSLEKTIPLEIAQSDNLHKIPKDENGGRMARREYLDTDFQIAVNEFDSTFASNSAIYAVASVDAHGLSSGYSSQIQVSYDRLTNKIVSNVISQKSAPKPYPNLYLNNDFFEDVITSSGKTRCTVFFDPEYGKILKKVGVNPQGEVEKVSLNYLKTSNEDYNYTIQFLNVDLQKEKRIPIRIVDASGNEINIPVANISPSNLSFEFGV